MLITEQYIQNWIKYSFDCCITSIAHERSEEFSVLLLSNTIIKDVPYSSACRYTRLALFSSRFDCRRLGENIFSHSLESGCDTSPIYALELLSLSFFIQHGWGAGDFSFVRALSFPRPSPLALFVTPPFLARIFLSHYSRARARLSK